jgi:hypothetical protein
MEIPEGAGRFLVELAEEIMKIITKAKETQDLTKRIQLYLEAAEKAIRALGSERQAILTDLRKLDIKNRDQVTAVWGRLHKYLHEDHIRPKLDKSIGGLQGCRPAVESQAQGLRLRKKEKQAAVEEFTKTLDQLENELRNLSSDFLPGGPSGMGVETLQPIDNLLEELRKSTDADIASRFEAYDDKLADLARAARRHPSHEDWIRKTGQIETLVAELQWAFR